MSAAAHFLRRRSSFLLQQRQKIHEISNSFLGTTGYTQNPARSPPFRGRKFSATSTAKPPEISAAESPSSSSKGTRRVVLAGAASLLLSSGAWYVTRDELPQVHHLKLPQVLPGHYQEERVPVQIEEKSLVFQSTEVPQEGAVEDVINNSGEAIPHEQEVVTEEQTVYEVAYDNVFPGEVTETVEITETVERQSFPDPPHTSNEVPLVIESDSPPYETAEEQSLPPKESDLENSVSSNESTEQVLLAEEAEAEDQSLVETLVDAVQETVEAVSDKVSAAKDYLFNETNGVSTESEDATGDIREEIIVIREKLREENPGMFYLDSEMDEKEVTHKETQALGQELELLKMLENGSQEYVDAYSVPSKLSASYLVQKGHEDRVRRYSEQKRDGEVEGLIETAAMIEEKLKEEQEEASLEEKRSKVDVDVLVGAIHTAEQLQAEIDGRTYKEQLQKIQEAHRHEVEDYQEAHKREVEDYQAKISAYAEGTDQLEKELKREKEEAAAGLRLQEEKAEERLQNELRQKEEEAVREKERLLVLEKAQAAASLTREKAIHLEDLYLVQLQVDALRTAFYTRSEEARVSHTAHKLAMGAFALEEAIKKGQAVEKEADLLIESAGGPGVDPLVDAVVSSLPSEALKAGASTRAHLHHKFTKLKGSLRELSLMPPGGGGVVAHFFAKLATNLKISERGSDDITNGGIEVVIGRVEELLAQDNLLEAATVLVSGVKGTAAESLAVDWANQARNRAIIEQGLQVLKAHVIAVASGLS